MKRTPVDLQAPLTPWEAGVDEAGRGPLAGPVVAAAVLWPEGAVLPGLNDSKKLSESRREELAPRIRAQSLCWGLGLADAAEIDALNILEATFLAMRRAVLALPLKPRALAIDGNRSFQLTGLGLPRLAVRTVIGGDGQCVAIAAASVLAKTARDHLMLHWDARYPQYGFKQHKGYGSQAHLDAIKRFGPSPIHRLSFKPLKTE